MSEAPQAAPIHLKLVAILGFLWNAIGCFDYVMTQTKNEGYLKDFTQEQLDFFYSQPAWVVAAWATAVFAGLFASLLLFLRKKLAVPLFVVSLLTMASTAVQSYFIRDGFNVMGSAGAIFTAIIFVFAVFLVMYSRAQATRGVLH